MSQVTKFITLGTAGGPMQNPDRAQPSHVLVHKGRPILIDSGEGAMGQLKRAGIEFSAVQEIFLSHHHFDHIGSLFACLGLNMMLQRRSPLTIYGPAGTQKIVNGLLDACDIPSEIGFGVPGQVLPHPRSFVTVHELAPGDTVALDDITVSCCENTHYRTEDLFGTEGFISLSLRFDTPDRSIVFSGDTGCCAALETLAQGADLFIGEMMDVDFTMDHVRAKNPDMPKDRLAFVHSHLSKHHLSPEQLGQMAARSAVKHVVAVHLAPGLVTPDNTQKFIDRIGSEFAGQISIGDDLSEY
jgi:ribonuclease BN (tRNA processing enzyme)